MAEVFAVGQVASVREILLALKDRLAEADAATGATALLQREPDGWIGEDAARDALVFGPWDPALDPDAYDRGYVFTEALQVAWQKDEGKPAYRVSFVGEAPAPEALGPGRTVKTGPDRHYLLWGTREADVAASGAAATAEFKEGRLPNPVCPLRYPAPASAREACLVTRELTDAATGEVVGFRYTGVVGAEDAE